MMLLIPLLALVAAANAAKLGGAGAPAKLRSQPANAGVVPQSLLQSQIVGGANVTSLTLVPWQVRLAISVADNPNAIGRCGGSIIDDEWILTAAHCIQDADKNYSIAPSVRIFFQGLTDGSYEKNRLSMDVAKENIFPHEKYTKNSTHVLNDIAVIKLNYPLPLKNSKTMVAIRLPKSSDKKKGRSYVGERVILSGFGKTNDSEGTSPVLKYVNFTVASRDACVKFYSASQILDMHICAVVNPNENTCQGDSGGPMAFLDKDKKYTLLGATSFGQTCAGPTYPVYASTNYFLEWVSKKTGLKF